MAVYVDPARHPFGRMIMCHMMADTRVELLEMATCIGVDHRWIQFRGSAREHFDICKRKRALAVQRGAIEVESRDLVELIRKRRAVENRKMGM